MLCFLGIWTKTPYQSIYESAYQRINLPEDLGCLFFPENFWKSLSHFYTTLIIVDIYTYYIIYIIIPSLIFKLSILQSSFVTESQSCQYPIILWLINCFYAIWINNTIYFYKECLLVSLLCYIKSYFDTSCNVTKIIHIFGVAEGQTRHGNTRVKTSCLKRI